MFNIVILLKILTPISIAASCYGLYVHRLAHQDPKWLKHTQMAALICASFLTIFTLGVPYFLVFLTSLSVWYHWLTSLF